ARGEVAGMRMRDRRERLHRAGCDHHAFREERAARDSGGDIARMVGGVREALDVLAPHLQLVKTVERASVREHEGALPAACRAELLQQSHAVRRATRAGDRNHEALRNTVFGRVFTHSAKRTLTAPEVSMSRTAEKTYAVNEVAPDPAVKFDRKIGEQYL